MTKLISRCNFFFSNGHLYSAHTRGFSEKLIDFGIATNKNLKIAHVGVEVMTASNAGIITVDHFKRPIVFGKGAELVSSLRLIKKCSSFFEK
jgi:hypothetical protein